MDRTLVVKCTHDRWTKRITFSSARNCTYTLLRNKVEQCFSLYATPYFISYKDDDGEVSDITTDSDLLEAIQYFQAGNDDPPASSASSILSGRSFGRNKITLRVHITVDYDGPSLSDTSSLRSMQEYKSRNGSQGSFSFTSGPSPSEIDDDAVTVSSRDTEGMGRDDATEYGSDLPTSQHPRADMNAKDTSSLHWTLRDDISNKASSSGRQPRENQSTPRLPEAAALMYPEDPSAVFERLKMEEAAVDDGSLFVPSADIHRGAAWLRDQNARTIRSMLGALPEPSISDADDSFSFSIPDAEEFKDIDGNLALERNSSGKWYYAYNSSGSGSQTQEFNGVDDGKANRDSLIIEMDESNALPPRPTSMNLHWLATQQQLASQPIMDTYDTQSTSSRLTPHSHNSDPLPEHISYDSIPPEVLQFIPVSPPPLELLTKCSECSLVLDSFKYVCSTCGEQTPFTETGGKGKNPFPSLDDWAATLQYPPAGHRTIQYSSSPASSSQTYVGQSVTTLVNGEAHKPLPSLPPLMNPSASATISQPHRGSGYELCSGCIESVGVIHAIEIGLGPSSSSPNGLTFGGNRSPTSPTDSQEAMSQWRRTAPRLKGQLRHAYLEKVWGHGGWANVEQDDYHACKCSTCNTVIINKRYKCASCRNFNLCRACYGQVHEVHPSHAFLLVPDKRPRSRSEPDFLPSTLSNQNEEHSMKHPGVTCAHCMMDIVGARFHCAVCRSVDICSNCESAGLPGNLDSDDGGHNSSHIMIKIPIPMDSNELQTMSRKAVHLWTGRDAANVLDGPRTRPRSDSGSEASSYARTVISSDRPGGANTNETDNHHVACKGCTGDIIGARFQCANCPSFPTAYDLCETCEPRSYLLHDPMHAFFKFPRPVERALSLQFALIPVLYKTPAGPQSSSYHSHHSLTNPRDYLTSLVHTYALCDRCMERIQGEWYRCVYCAKDLCDACQELDTHNNTHFFLVLKSEVDMHVFRHFAEIDNSGDTPPPMIPYSVYR